MPSAATGTVNCAAQAAVFVHWMRRAQHPPRAADRLVHLDRHRHVLVVAQRDFVLDFVARRADLLEVGLVPLADDVERVPDLQLDGFVLRGVRNAVFADELDAAFRVGLIDADDTGRHRRAETRLLLVPELVIDLDDVLERRSGVLEVVIVEGLALDDIALQHRHAGARQHAHLLRLAVVDRRPAPERVEVVVGERLLRHAFLDRVGAARRRREPLPQLVPHAVQVAGDELQLRVPERRAAAVGERDPPVEIAKLVVARDGEHVVRVPRELRREVGRLDALLRRARVLKRPDQRRTAVEIARQLWEADVIGVQAGDDLRCRPARPARCCS